MPSPRSLALAAACLLCLSACSAAIAPPYDDTPRGAEASSSSRTAPGPKKPSSKLPRAPKGSGATMSAWAGSCTASATCSRQQRDCPAGTICVFAGVGQEGSCFTLEQRRYCSQP
jgi:hypothetical protein